MERVNNATDGVMEHRKTGFDFEKISKGDSDNCVANTFLNNPLFFKFINTLILSFSDKLL